MGSRKYQNVPTSLSWLEKWGWVGIGAVFAVEELTLAMWYLEVIYKCGGRADVEKEGPLGQMEPQR
jgi:hypothetical protein